VMGVIDRRARHMTTIQQAWEDTKKRFITVRVVLWLQLLSTNTNDCYCNTTQDRTPISYQKCTLLNFARYCIPGDHILGALQATQKLRVVARLQRIMAAAAGRPHTRGQLSPLLTLLTRSTSTLRALVGVWRSITHDPIAMPTFYYCSTFVISSFTYIVVSFTFILSQQFIGRACRARIQCPSTPLPTFFSEPLPHLSLCLPGPAPAALALALRPLSIFPALANQIRRTTS
jgi:hypothetical protein